MSADDVSRMLMPRKTAPRSNSSTSLSSQASTSSTVTASSVQQNGATAATNGGWIPPHKRPVRSLWPASKSEPISGLSTARPQSTTTATSGPSAASAISALHAPSPMAPSPHPNIPSPGAQQQNGASRMQQPNENTPVLYLTPMNGTFERKTITVPFYPDVLRIGRQTNGKTVPTPLNGYFDSKVLSRQHAEIWADRTGKIWIRDVKSSNGTFVNGQRLSQENKDSDPHELKEQDMLELGIDIVSEDQKTVVHHKVAARVELAGFYGANNMLDLNFGDLDPSASAGLLGASLAQGGGLMRRTASQSSIGSNGRAPSLTSNGSGNLAQQRQQHFWLQTVNMDQIVKKLNVSPDLWSPFMTGFSPEEALIGLMLMRLQAEYKAAKQQSLDLQRAAQYIDSILVADQQPSKKESSQRDSPIEKTKGTSLKDSLKARFSDPPAPPPQAPLPEKPDVIHRLGSSLDLPNFLRRSDTEKPPSSSVNGSPSKGATSDQGTAAQIASLAEALNAARKEVETQSIRLKEVEDLLVQERVRREDAEERAKRLEKDRKQREGKWLEPPETSSKDEESTTPIEDGNGEATIVGDAIPEEIPASDLRKELEALKVEFSEVKAAAERWKKEKEEVEKERDAERAERQSLAEMIERIRAEEVDRLAKEKRREERRKVRRSSSTSSGALSGTTANGAIEKVEDLGDDSEDEVDRVDSEKTLLQNGHADRSLSKDGGPDIQAIAARNAQLYQAAPYLSAVSVVLIGVAVMALVNRMQKGER